MYCFVTGSRGWFLTASAILARRSADSECWLWTDQLAPSGYGQMHVTGFGIRRAHRVAFFLANGYWPKVARHTCDTQRCCNARHILDGTNADNVRDRVIRGRSAMGERVGGARLKEADVLEVRTLLGLCTVSNLARAYDVSWGTIAAIRDGTTWRYLK